MGQSSSSVPPDHWHARLIFDNTSLHNNKATCTELGLLYQISTPRTLKFIPTGTTSIVRRDMGSAVTMLERGKEQGKGKGKGVLLAEIENHTFKSDRIRFAVQEDELDSGSVKKGEAVGGGNGMDGVPFVKEGDFLKLVTWKSTKRAFQARNGQSYVWVTATWDGSLQLFTSGGEKTTLPIAKCSYCGFTSMKIELARGTEEIVDEIFVTALIMEKKARQERNSNAAEAAAA